MSRLSAWRFRAHFEDFANAHGLARPGEKQMIASMTAWGQTRKWRRLPVRSVLPPTTDIRRSSEHVRLVPIVLQKSFSGDERNFLGLLMRFVCGDVRGLMVSHKIDHGPAHRRYRALQQWRRLKICFREIFGIVRFSTFATISATRRHHRCPSAISAFLWIVLQKSQNAVRLNFRQTPKQAATVDRRSLKRATEAASELITE